LKPVHPAQIFLHGMLISFLQNKFNKLPESNIILQ
jgi:hypothetical protein